MDECGRLTLIGLMGDRVRDILIQYNFHVIDEIEPAKDTMTARHNLTFWKGGGGMQSFNEAMDCIGRQMAFNDAENDFQREEEEEDDETDNSWPANGYQD